MSRNSNRIGAPTGAEAPDQAPPQQQQMLENPTSGFSFVVPTEFVELPSEGRYYPESHPLYGQSTIELRQMTAKEEDILTSRTLIRKGVALDRVISSLIVDRRINPDSILVGDRNAMVVAIRTSAYGNIYETKVSCPACGAQQEYAFDLNDKQIYSGEDADIMDVMDNNDGTFNTVLPKTKVEVRFKLLTGNDEKKLLNGVESDRKSKNKQEKNVTRQLKNFIVSVNEDETIKAINYVVENMPSSDAHHLRTAYQNANPNVDLSQIFECESCSHEQLMEVPLTVDFFWPKR